MPTEHIGRSTAKRRLPCQEIISKCDIQTVVFWGEWCSTIQEEFKLSGVALIGIEIGGFMQIVLGLKNFYYLPHFYDMRYGYARGMEVIIETLIKVTLYLRTSSVLWKYVF